jgi:flagellar hook-associated protein 1 FlgK
VLNGGTSTFVDEWSKIVYQVGSDARTATDSQKTHEAMTTQVQKLRDAVSAVSMDEEAANMMKFSRAYESIARYFQAVQQTLDTLLKMV